MTNKVKIANRALVRIAKDRINSFTENTPEAILINEIYDDVCREVLDEGPWSFATKRVELALTGNTPSYEFTYEYQLPSDFIHAREIPKVNGDIDYQIEGDKLLANVSTLSLRYISDTTNESIWPPKFVKCRWLKLAIEMCTTFRRNETLVKRLLVEYREARDTGLARDAQQSSTEEIESNDFLDIRR